MELLLAVAILLLLAGALVVSFDPLRRGAQLDEGVNRFESLIRFAQAEAANKGRRVRLDIKPSGAESSDDVVQELSLSWEPDPGAAPGKFEKMSARFWDEEINESIGVLSASSLEKDAAAKLPSEAQETPQVSEPDETQTPSPVFPGLTFFPDGSSDSAEITLVSRDPEDRRTAIVKIIGPTGWIRSETIEREEDASAPAVEIIPAVGIPDGGD